MIVVHHRGAVQCDLWSILFPHNPETCDALLLALWEHGTAGISEEQGGLRAYFGDDLNPSALAALTEAFRTVSIRTEPAVQQSLAPENWDPILVGQRFYIAPPCNSQPTPSGRLRLEIDAVTAYGTGRHETTQLCLEALERYLEPEHTVVDVGCGSGILSAAARLLGARRVFSCDIHEDAMAASKQHVSTPVFLGSADAVASTSADLLVANISASVLDSLAFDLKRITRPGGLLILSGFIHDRLPRHCRPEETLTLNDWLCWICRPEAITPATERSDPQGLSHKLEWWL